MNGAPDFLKAVQFIIQHFPAIVLVSLAMLYLKLRRDFGRD